MPSRPIIAIPSPQHAAADGSAPRVGVPATYVAAIAAVGGLPVLIPAVSQDGAVADLLAHAAGLCFPGGGDLEPQRYGRRSTTQLRAVDPDLDAFEIECCRVAARRDLPVLGICRGHQLVNVALGGTLVQELPAGSHEPTEPAPRHLPRHTIHVGEGTHLRRIVGAGRLLVNSFHHQAVDAVAGSLRVAAVAPDGVVEALESPDGRVLTLQCHPEAMVGEAWAAALFSDLVARAT